MPGDQAQARPAQGGITGRENGRRGDLAAQMAGMSLRRDNAAPAPAPANRELVLRQPAQSQNLRPANGPERAQQGPGVPRVNVVQPPGQQGGQARRPSSPPNLDSERLQPNRQPAARNVARPQPPAGFRRRDDTAEVAQQDRRRPAFETLQPIETSTAGPSQEPMKTVLSTEMDNYTLVRTLQAPSEKPGEGMSHGVYVILDSRKRPWVGKRLTVGTASKNLRAKAEIKALQMIKDKLRQHEHVNMLREVSWPDGTRHPTIVLDFCDGGSLQAGIDEYRKIGQRTTEPMVLHIFYGITKALTLLHHGIADHTDKNSKVRGWDTVCHLDIKPANVLLSRDQFPGKEHFRWPRVVLADFGCAVTQTSIQDGVEGRAVQDNGTPGWFPPEGPSVTQSTLVGRYGKPTDIWQAAGVIQAMCLLLSQPDMTKLMQPCGPKYSGELNCLVATCLNPDYRRRPSAIDLSNELRKLMIKRGLQV